MPGVGEGKAMLRKGRCILPEVPTLSDCWADTLTLLTPSPHFLPAHSFLQPQGPPTHTHTFPHPRPPGMSSVHHQARLANSWEPVGRP